MTYPFRNLVFEGGGVKGIAYVGALEVLQDKGVLERIDRFGGTSAGAINAVLLAAGYDRDELREILYELDFRNFLDDEWGVIRDTKRLIKKYGWYKGKFFRRWIGGLLEKKLGSEHATFRHLQDKTGKGLYLYGTNLSTGFGEVFSTEHTPRMRIADATRISMSIPLFFAAVRNHRDDVYVDGGVLNNYPLRLFDRLKYIAENDHGLHARATPYYDEINAPFLAERPRSSPYVYNRETLGFRLDSEREIAIFRDGMQPPSRDIDDFFDYALALVKTIFDQQANQHLHSDDWQRSVYIDTLGVGSTDFGLKKETKDALVASGVENTRKYFDWYDHEPADAEVANRPPNWQPPG